VATAEAPITYDGETRTIGLDQSGISLTQSQVQDLEFDLTQKASSTELTDGLATKANTTHSHSISDVTDLQSELNGKSPLAGSSSITTLGTVTNLTSPTAAGSAGVRKTTISTANPSGGADGDVWLKYS
jgi:hypothetical protein